MKASKLLIQVLAGVLMLAVGFAVNVIADSISPGLTAGYSNPVLFRHPSDPLRKASWLIPFVAAFILFWLWNFAKPLIKGNNFLSRGLMFAFFYWVLTLPGILFSYTSFNFSFGLAFSWTVARLAESAAAGIVYARFRP